MKQFQVQIQHYLKQYFDMARDKNPKFSMRAFSNKLGIGSGDLSQILSGKRVVSIKKANALLDKMRASDDVYEKIFYSNHLDFSSTFNSEFKDFSEYQVLNQNLSKVVLEDDLCLKILSLFETEDFRFDSSWMAERLNVSVARVEELVQSSEFEKSISQAQLNQFVKNYFKTTDSKKSESIRKYHKSSLEEAILKVDDLETEERDITSCVFACNPDNYEEAKKLIRSFHHQFMAVMCSGPKQEVYKLNIQFYPCTELDIKSDNNEV